MRWPSRRSFAIGAVAFVAGFVVAVALAWGFVSWVYTSNLSGRQNWVIDPLVASTELLEITDKRPEQLTRVIVANARQNSLTAATQFSRLTEPNQQITLRQFTRLNHSATLRADHAPFADTARLARLMVLCTHASAAPGWLAIDKNAGSGVELRDAATVRGCHRSRTQTLGRAARVGDSQPGLRREAASHRLNRVKHHRWPPRPSAMRHAVPGFPSASTRLGRNTRASRARLRAGSPTAASTS